MLTIDEEYLQNYTSFHTRSSYRADILQFFDYLHKSAPEITRFVQIQRKHVIGFRNWLAETGGRDGGPAAPKTLARKLASLSSYFDFLVESDNTPFNPVSSVKRPRRAVISPTNALTVAQVKELLQAIEHSIQQKRVAGYLHHALLMTFFTTGLRKNEIIYLKRSNYKQINDFHILEYRGKGGKLGQKVVHPICVESLERYLTWMQSVDRQHTGQDWLFQPTKNPSDPSNLNKPLNPKTVNTIVDQYAKKIGLNFKVTPHSARATFIGELLEQGIDIYSVSKEVNHSSVTTTQEYDKRRKKLADSPVLKLHW